MARQLRQEAVVEDLDLDVVDGLEVAPDSIDEIVEEAIKEQPPERRPMDEAPREGTVVIGYHPESYPEGQPVRWKTARQYHIVERRWADGGKWVDATYLAVLWQQPIEWIPLAKEDVV